MKKCKDCEHSLPDVPFFMVEEYRRCINPIVVTNLRSNTDYSYCEIERKDWYLPEICGSNAKHFEPKKTSKFVRWIKLVVESY